VRVDGTRLTDPEHELTSADVTAEGVVIRVGKKRAVRVVCA
jgi:tyrosyl-tRNA synthetase